MAMIRHRNSSLPQGDTAARKAAGAIALFSRSWDEVIYRDELARPQQLIHARGHSHNHPAGA
jgi:hypothetical protein